MNTSIRAYEHTSIRAYEHTSMWIEETSARIECIRLIAAENGGNLNGFTPSDIDRALSLLPSEAVPFLPAGCSCFCGRADCGCRERRVTRYDVATLTAVVKELGKGGVTDMDLD